jgi:hypothetical protein
MWCPCPGPMWALVQVTWALAQVLWAWVLAQVTCALARIFVIQFCRNEILDFSQLLSSIRAVNGSGNL